MEARGLTAKELSDGYRLACQATILGDVEVVVPEESRISRVSILSAGVHRAVELRPWIRKQTIRVPEATLERQVADMQNLQQAMGPRYDGLKPTLRALRQLPTALREGNGLVTLLIADGQIVRIDAGAGPDQLLGIAFDIGTTTVVGYLLDLETGAQLSVSSLLNPQTRYGDDVVSRIDFSMRDDGKGLHTLQREIVRAMNQIISDTTKAAGARPEDVLGVAVVGNTTMHHLFLGISPAALARSPYVPAVTEATCVTAKDLGLTIYPEGHVWVLPNIAGWVGADTVGVILATGVHEHEGMALAIDIGTNGEMALGSRERLLTCSTAAGPAFEGAHLSCGMRAADGAIDAVNIDSDVRWHAIGNSAPRGICGSGLVDLVAEMLRAGVIDATGMMQSPEALRSNGAEQLATRLRQGRQKEFLLVDASNGAAGRELVVTQRDIRELQLAKGAIRAGIQILMKELGIGPESVTRVYMAGAFGNYIKPSSALAIGLIPHFPNAEIVPVGNAAGSGARMALLSESAREEASRILSHVEYLELSGRPDFQDEFAEAMIF